MGTPLKPYRVFPHTADVGLWVQGKTLQALFKNAALGMLHLVTHLKSYQPKKKIPLILKSNSLESLLVDWLHEILYFLTVKRLGICKVQLKLVKPYGLKAILWGDKLEAKRHSVFREIKAVTHHDLKIQYRKNHYQTKIIFDI
jgi:SHS2 domain-containing protein